MRHAFLLSLTLALSGASALGILAIPSLARADGEERALALDLFQQGRALLKDGDYARAATKFESASRLMHTFGVLLNLAECQEKLGRTASAWATWREARAVAVVSKNADDEALAREREKALEPSLARLTLVFPPNADGSDLEVLRDGTLVPREAWGQTIPIDPGRHLFTVRARGKQSRSIEVVVQPNQQPTRVTLVALDDEPPTQSSPPTAVTAPTSSASSAATRVTLRANDTRAALEKQTGTVLGGISTWQTVCTAPCGISVDANGVYRVAGDGLWPSGSFSLGTGRDEVTLDSRSGNFVMRVGGMVLALGGGAAAALGGGSLAAGVALDQSGTGSPLLRDSLKYGGIAVTSLGVLGAVLGAYLYFSNGTHVHTDSAPP
jgi:hypothetical protein